MSERTIVCARANHQYGYGYVDPSVTLRELASGSYGGRAHGFVLLYITQVEQADIDAVLKWLESHDVREVFAPSWKEWYGGRFEPVALFWGEPLHGDSHPFLNPAHLSNHGVRTLGDNRAYAVVTWTRLRELEERLELG